MSAFSPALRLCFLYYNYEILSKFGTLPMCLRALVAHSGFITVSWKPLNPPTAGSPYLKQCSVLQWLESIFSYTVCHCEWFSCVRSYWLLVCCGCSAGHWIRCCVTLRWSRQIQTTECDCGNRDIHFRALRAKQMLISRPDRLCKHATTMRCRQLCEELVR